MTIQGMSQGMAFTNMSYYIQDTGYPGGPDVEECGAGIYDGTQGTGIYRTAFNMDAGATTTGAAIIVFEVGNVYEGAAGSNAVDYAQPDKLTWEYNGVFNSEYSAVHMGDTDDSGSNPDVMHGIGYMRGMIGSEVAASKNAYSAWSSPGAPLSQVTGSRLLSGSESLTWNNTAGSSTTYSGATTPDNDDLFGSTAQYAITADDKEYEYLDITQAAAAGITHGTFKDLDRYLWDSGAGTYASVSTGNYAGVYTGHDQEETADINGNSFVGSSAVTLHENDNPYASRQAMMVVPVVGGGIIDIHVEAALHGTWHRHMCLCPIKLPKWGNADNKTGYQADESPYDNATDASRHNFSDPSSPTSGAIAGSNTTFYHVNSQDRQYRQQGIASWSGTARSGGHVISALNVDSAGSTEWKGVVNRFDWVFTDNGGVTRVPVGFYAIDIGGTVYVVEVGDTNTAGIAQAGVVKDVTA